jgi:hypothetical protein
VHFFGVGRDLNGYGAGGLTEDTLDAQSGRDGAQIAGAKPTDLAAGGIPVADFAFYHDLILGNFAMPVEKAIVAGLVVADEHFQARIAHEGVRIGTLQIAYKEEVLEIGARLVFGARDAQNRAVQGEFAHAGSW